VTEPFCVAGPQVTPHVVAQQLLSAGEERDVSLALEPGRYRLRALGAAGSQTVSASEDGAPSVTAALTADGWSEEDLAVSTTPVLRLANATPDERLLLLERTAWADRAVTAATVIGMQTFRDIFSGELLRPDQEINIASLTIAFTDLRDSTRIYQEIGDAAAFGKVLDHFEVLREEVAAAEGSLIKTIGDAVMAVFPRPLNGLKAMLRAQERLEASEKLAGAFSLKAGLHTGPCIAVTMNERLDYFGSVVNLASRLERYSSSRDVIVSEAVRADPEVEAYLSAQEELSADPFEAEVKGFDRESFRLWRVSRGGARS
jgi:class 3 adenylate cyclase